MDHIQVGLSMGLAVKRVAVGYETEQENAIVLLQNMVVQHALVLPLKQPYAGTRFVRVCCIKNHVKNQNHASQISC